MNLLTYAAFLSPNQPQQEVFPHLKKNSTLFFENQMQKITFAPRFLKTRVEECVFKAQKPQ